MTPASTTLTNRRLVVMGSPDLGVPALQALVAAGNTVVGVFTQPDKPRGRGQQLQPCPMKAAAQALGLPVFSPPKLTPEAVQTLAALQPELIIVMAYGLILPPSVLALCPCINTHVSDLPRWRGAAPMQRALMAGDTHTALCLMAMEAGLDTGAVYQRLPITLPPDMTFGDLYHAMQTLCTQAVPQLVDQWDTVQHQAVPQATTGITLAPKITAADMVLDFTQPATVLHNQIRGLSPWPGIKLQLGDQVVKVLRTTVGTATGPAGTVLAAANGLTIGTGAGCLVLTTLHPAGKKPMSAAEFLRGNALPVGTPVSCPATS